MGLAGTTPQLGIGRAISGSGASIAIRGIGSTPGSIGIEQSMTVIIGGVYYTQGRVRLRDLEIAPALPLVSDSLLEQFPIAKRSRDRTCNTAVSNNKDIDVFDSFVMTR